MILLLLAGCTSVPLGYPDAWPPMQRVEANECPDLGGTYSEVGETSPGCKAGLRLAELGVAGLLAKCSGRRSWRIKDGYCIPATPNGQPDGFRVVDSR